MRQFVLLMILVLLIVACLPIEYPVMHGDGTANFLSHISVSDEDGYVIPDAEVRLSYLYQTEDTVTLTDSSGVASVMLKANWGATSSLRYTKHSASFNRVNAVVSKEGYNTYKVPIPTERLKWVEVLGVEMWRPKIDFECVIVKVTDQTHSD